MDLEKQRPEYDWTNVKQDVPEWFRDAKFGLFFHWGIYSVPAYQNEWYSRNMYVKGLQQNIYHEATYGKLHDFGYKDFIPMWKAERFDPEEWADLVQLSGARYAGPVTEHADNFSLWNSRVNPVNAMAMGPHRDLYGECAAAFKKRGIRLLASFHHAGLWGWFMSTDNEADVYDPANEVFYGPALPLETTRHKPYRLPDDKFNSMWRDKVIEVIDQYGPDVVYFDSRAFIIAEKYRYQVVNHYYNVTGHRDGIITYKQTDFPDGIGVYDLERGHSALIKPFVWQCDDRLEDNVTWCMVQEPKYHSSGRIIHQLCDIVSKNGNLLLNVGPYADGSFHPDAVKALREIGEWLKINGEAIYGSRPFAVAAEGPVSEKDENYDTEKLKQQLASGKESLLEKHQFSSEDLRFTTGNGNLYVIAMGWPEDGWIKIKTLRSGGILGNVRKAEMLGADGLLTVRQDAEALAVRFPEKKPCESAWVIRIPLA